VKIPRGPAAVREEFLQECHQKLGRQEVTLTLEPEDLPVCISQTLREIEEVYFCTHFCDLIILFGDNEVF